MQTTTAVGEDIEIHLPGRFDEPVETESVLLLDQRRSADDSVAAVEELVVADLVDDVAALGRVVVEQELRQRGIPSRVTSPLLEERQTDRTAGAEVGGRHTDEALEFGGDPAREWSGREPSVLLDEDVTQRVEQLNIGRRNAHDLIHTSCA
jgi:hypothetical protein